MGWRYTLLCLGGICIFIFFLRFVVFRFRESPKFLLYRGRDAKAVEVLHQIAKFNGRESTVTLQVFEALNDEAGSTGSADFGQAYARGECEEVEGKLGHSNKCRATTI